MSPGIDSVRLGIDSWAPEKVYLVGRYDNPILTRFLAPIDCSKIPVHKEKFRKWRYINGGSCSGKRTPRKQWSIEMRTNKAWPV